MEQKNENYPISAEVSINHALRFEKIQTIEQKNFVALQCQCTLCASDLVITVYRQASAEEIKEEAKCPQCQLRLRSKIHLIM